LLEPRMALDQAGAKTQVVSPAGKKVKGWNHKEWAAKSQLMSRSTLRRQTNSMRCCCLVG
jgi:hypothetical protein